MSLTQCLIEFRFNLETIDLLTTLNRTSQQIIDEMKLVGFSSNMINFILTNKSLLNGVLLRLNLYNEQKLNETTIRTNLLVLNNTIVTSFLDNFFFVKKNNVLVPSLSLEKEIMDDMDEVVEEPSKFEQFFKTRVIESQDNTHIVKSTDFHNAFTEWWNGMFFEEEIPDKNALKEYLTTKLGKPNKNTWSSVYLV